MQPGGIRDTCLAPLNACRSLLDAGSSTPAAAGNHSFILCDLQVWLRPTEGPPLWTQGIQLVPVWGSECSCSSRSVAARWPAEAQKQHLRLPIQPASLMQQTIPQCSNTLVMDRSEYACADMCPGYLLPAGPTQLAMADSCLPLQPWLGWLTAQHLPAVQAWPATTQSPLSSDASGDVKIAQLLAADLTQQSMKHAWGPIRQSLRCDKSLQASTAAACRSYLAGDSRAAVAPFLAHSKLHHDSYKWMLFGDDDTVFFIDNIADFLSDFDPQVPYFISGGQREPHLCRLLHS